MEESLAGIGLVVLVVIGTLLCCVFKPADSEYKDLDYKFPRK